MHAQEATTQALNDGISGLDDFYSILGVQHDAQPHEIKQAYRNLVRILHPDRAGARQDDEAMAETATDLCVLVNEIYVSPLLMHGMMVPEGWYPVTLQR